MSTAAINPKGPRVYPKANSPLAWAETFLTSTVGQKLLVGFTGLSLVGFLVFHMAGNLKMFSGPESFNEYAHFLKHSIGVWLWVARAGLLLVFLTHLFLALRLRWKAKAARPVGYRVMKSAQATPQAKTMVWTGIVILLFAVYHISHYTLGLVHGEEQPDGTQLNYLTLTDPAGHHDAYRMVLAGFHTPYISAIYLFTQVLLFIHLGHGIQASLQTLGLVGKRFTPLAKLAGWGIAFTILAGNVAVVTAVWAGWVK